MLEAGAIHLSQFPWCNVVVLVQKKDGTLHFCVDFRHLNTCMKKDSYPLPQIQEALESMVGSVHFSSMDFKLGFWQIKMAPGSQQYTAFTVGNLGFYEFTHMPFGLCNAPTMFQHLMQNTLGELNLTYCVIYLDDVIVFGHTEEEHLECLCMVFKRFWEFKGRGILPSRENVWAMQEFLMLKTYMQVCAFCGLAGHYRRFIKVFVSYSLHYLMFGRHPCLPVDYYFLTVSAYKHSHHVPAYVMVRLGDASRKLILSLTSRQIARPKSRNVIMIEPQVLHN